MTASSLRKPAFSGVDQYVYISVPGTHHQTMFRKKLLKYMTNVKGAAHPTKAL